MYYLDAHPRQRSLCRYEGLRFDDFREVISALRAQLAKEVGPVKDRRANKLYEKWVELSGGVIRGANPDDASGNEDGGVELLLAAGDATRPSPVEAAGAAALKRSTHGATLTVGDNDAARVASGVGIFEGPPEVVALHLVKRSDDDQMRRIYEVMSKANHVIDYYLQVCSDIHYTH